MPSLSRPVETTNRSTKGREAEGAAGRVPAGSLQKGRGLNDFGGNGWEGFFKMVLVFILYFCTVSQKVALECLRPLDFLCYFRLSRFQERLGLRKVWECSGRFRVLFFFFFVCLLHGTQLLGFIVVWGWGLENNVWTAPKFGRMRPKCCPKTPVHCWQAIFFL